MAVPGSTFGERAACFGRPGRPADGAQALSRPQPTPHRPRVSASCAKGDGTQASPRLGCQAAGHRKQHTPHQTIADGRRPLGDGTTPRQASGVRAALGSSPACVARGPRRTARLCHDPVSRPCKDAVYHPAGLQRRRGL